MYPLYLHISHTPFLDLKNYSKLYFFPGHFQYRALHEWQNKSCVPFSMYQSVWCKEHPGRCEVEHNVYRGFFGMTCLSQHSLSGSKNIHFCSWVMSQPKKTFSHHTQLCMLPLHRHSPLGAPDLLWVLTTSGWKYLIGWSILGQGHKNKPSQTMEINYFSHVLPSSFTGFILIIIPLRQLLSLSG